MRGDRNRTAQHLLVQGLALATAWGLAWLLAWIAGIAPPPGSDPLWYAPRGIAFSPAAADWLAVLERSLAAADRACPRTPTPRLDPRVPAAAYRVAVSPQRPVVLTKDAVVQRMLVVGHDAQGCLWVAETEPLAMSISL